MNILKGKDLMLFVKGENNTYKPLAYSTSCSVSLSTDTQEISSKDHGNYSAKIPGNNSWEVSTENLFTLEDFKKLANIWENQTAIDVVFAEVDNKSAAGLSVCGGTTTAWTYDSSEFNMAGTGYISSLSVNANNGESANYSITITGTGKFNYVAPTSGTGE